MSHYELQQHIDSLSALIIQAYECGNDASARHWIALQARAKAAQGAI